MMNNPSMSKSAYIEYIGNPEAMEAIKAEVDTPITVHLSHIRMTKGNVYDALVLSQIRFWHGLSTETFLPRIKHWFNDHLWVVKTHDEWINELGLNSHSTIRDCLARLENYGYIIKEQHKSPMHGYNAVGFVRINWEIYQTARNKATEEIKNGAEPEYSRKKKPNDVKVTPTANVNPDLPPTAEEKAHNVNPIYTENTDTETTNTNIDSAEAQLNPAGSQSADSLDDTSGDFLNKTSSHQNPLSNNNAPPLPPSLAGELAGTYDVMIEDTGLGYGRYSVVRLDESGRVVETIQQFTGAVGRAEAYGVVARLLSPVATPEPEVAVAPEKKARGKKDAAEGAPSESTAAKQPATKKVKKTSVKKTDKLLHPHFFEAYKEEIAKGMGWNEKTTPPTAWGVISKVAKNLANMEHAPRPHLVAIAAEMMEDQGWKNISPVAFEKMMPNTINREIDLPFNDYGFEYWLYDEDNGIREWFDDTGRQWRDRWDYRENEETEPYVLHQVDDEDTIQARVDRFLEIRYHEALEVLDENTEVELSND